MNGCYDVKGINSNLPDNERGFKHNWQSYRVVSSLEEHRKNFKDGGINLTNFTLWGILNHTKTEFKSCDYGNNGENCGYMKQSEVCVNHDIDNKFSLGFYNQYINSIDNNFDWSYEAFVVNKADEIAQRHYDIEDGIEANIIDKDNIIGEIERLFNDFLDESNKEYIDKIKKEKDKGFYMPLMNHLIVNLLSKNMINDSRAKLNEFKKEKEIITSEDFKEIRDTLNLEEEIKRIDYNEDFGEVEKRLEKYLYERIINSSIAQKMDAKSDFLLGQLTKAYITNPQQLSDGTIKTLIKNMRRRINKDSIKLLNSDIRSELEELRYYDTDFDINKVEIGAQRILLNRLHKTDWPPYKYALLRTICEMFNIT